MTSVLLLVDVQRNTLLPPRPVPAAGVVSAAIEDLLRRARRAEALVVHIRNHGGQGEPDAPGTPGWELVHEVLEGEHVVDRFAPDAFAGTRLAALVPPGAPVVVAGLRSELCVGATALAALQRGHATTLVRGAHATYDGEAPASVIARQVEAGLREAGVFVLDRQAVTFQPISSWVGSQAAG
ncbi:isochorismatase family protein [Streptomyces sp. 4N509B]|uniref:isochorismatase family protein n=1 Tax=Streptomyces sp. 4N509B TaxID=3457413 RepID=UPI003FD010D6